MTTCVKCDTHSSFSAASFSCLKEIKETERMEFLLAKNQRKLLTQNGKIMFTFGVILFQNAL